MALCDFTNGDGVCSRCGARAPRGAEPLRHRQRCAAVPKRPKLAPCPHLGEPTGASVRVYGCGCPSERRNGFDTATYECAQFVECLPRYNATRLSREGIALCITCEHNPALARQPAAQPANQQPDRRYPQHN